MTETTKVRPPTAEELNRPITHKGIDEAYDALRAFLVEYANRTGHGAEMVVAINVHHALFNADVIGHQTAAVLERTTEVYILHSLDRVMARRNSGSTGETFSRRTTR